MNLVGGSDQESSYFSYGEYQDVIIRSNIMGNTVTELQKVNVYNSVNKGKVTLENNKAPQGK